MKRQLRMVVLDAAGPLKPSVRIVLDVIARMALGDGTLRWGLSNAQLMRETGYCERTITRARRELHRRGLIEILGGGVNHDRIEVRVIVPEAVENLRQAVSESRSGAGMSTPGRPNVYPVPYIDPRACPDPTGYQLQPQPTTSSREPCLRHVDKPGKNCRRCATSPRHRAANPRASGTNPRAGYVTPIPPPYVAPPRPAVEPPAALLADLRDQLARRTQCVAS